MNIFEIGVAHGEERGEKRGIEKGIEIGVARGEKRGIGKGAAQTLVKNIESAMQNFGIDLQQACEGLDTSIEEYEHAKQTLALLKDTPTTPNDTDDEI